MRALILCTTLLATPSIAMAQGHGATPATPKAPAGDTAHAGPPGAKAAEPDPATAKKPTVSRVTLTPPVSATTSATHATPTGTSEGGHGAAGGGYVAIGSRPKSTAAAKKKPVVSGSPIATSSPAGHGAESTTHATAAPAATHGTPPGDLPTVSPSPAATSAAHGGTPPSPSTAAKPTGPTRLADVHGRLAAALAGARQGTGGHGASPRPPGSEDGASPPAETPRITLSWPKPRWQVVWPEASPAAAPAVPDAAATADPPPGRPPRR